MMASWERGRPARTNGNGAMALLRLGRCGSRPQGGCLQHRAEAQRRPKGQDAGGTPALPRDAVPAAPWGVLAGDFSESRRAPFGKLPFAREIGARTGSPDGRGGQYGLFYNAVPDGAAFTGSAWIYGLQQNQENRTNLALVNTGEVDDSRSTFGIEIYDENGTFQGIKFVHLEARRWRQINSILANHAPGITQAYVWIDQFIGNNPFLAYAVVNDGGAPGERSGDGAYLPARE